MIKLERDAKPKDKDLYRLSGKELTEILKQLEDILENEFIKPSKSPRGAAILFVKKG